MQHLRAVAAHTSYPSTPWIIIEGNEQESEDHLRALKSHHRPQSVRLKTLLALAIAEYRHEGELSAGIGSLKESVRRQPARRISRSWRPSDSGPGYPRRNVSVWTVRHAVTPTEHYRRSYQAKTCVQKGRVRGLKKIRENASVTRIGADKNRRLT